MPTHFEEIFDLFSSSITDYEFLNLSIQDQNHILEGWLLNAIAEFNNCKIDLSDRSNDSKQFNITLGDLEKKIIVKYMICEWLSPRLYTLDNLINHLSNKDISLFSPANLLKEIRETHNKATREADRLKRLYGHKHFDPNNYKHNSRNKIILNVGDLDG
ncbi:MAG: hypothetical protein N3A61_07230, partial [Ignavibacteria bacterium]|nr:hypothetical protein [Ignavibacteria bacterium]